MNKFVLIIKHERDRDLFFGHYSIKILGGIRGKLSSEWLSEDTTYLPKSVVITIPDNIINAFFIAVGMESKFNGVATYTSERVMFMSESIHDKLKEICVTSILASLIDRNNKF